MRGYTVEKNLKAVGHVKTHLHKLVTQNDMRGSTVEKNLTAVGHVNGHFTKLLT